MSLVNKLTRALCWLRWSTICAILFYVFFIGLILHSTSYKLQHTLKARSLHDQKHKHYEVERNSIELQRGQLRSASQQQRSSVATKNNMLHVPNVDSSSRAHIGNTMSSKYISSSPNIAPPDRGTPTQLQALVGASAGKRTVTGLEQRRHAVEPETIIIAASSTNEKQILEKALKRADKNGDSGLSIKELAVYINRRILDHIDEAIAMNPREFRHVDISPADGVVTWDEYHRFFLKSHGMSDIDIDEHDEIKHTALNRKAREDMMRDKARWSEAARTDLFSLTIDEYLSFRHPESSVSNLLELVDDLLRQFDQDGDDQLTIEEFSDINMDDDDDLMRKSLISKTVVERREEFKRIIDKNKDGKADRGELLNYVNPRTPRYALQEAATIFSLCDENRDGKLTLDEMVANADIILTSKAIDTENSFHTEF